MKHATMRMFHSLYTSPKIPQVNQEAWGWRGMQHSWRI